ncbi:MAG: fumarylacetoacetate hydrolase family protein [Microbacteriaceae bacterium]|nr:fumarylacetoacetate hydrolase family protein [Microbacteriaceae bacterium]
MKFGRVRDHGEAVPVRINHDRVHGIELPHGLDWPGFLGLPRDEQDGITVSAGRRFRRALDEVEFLAPVEPRALRDYVTFEAHIAGMKKGEPGDGTVPEQWYEAPRYLYANPWSVIGTGAEVPMPPGTERLDFELEVAAVVAHTVRDVAPEDAASHIAGYCIWNDWSARDLQGAEMRVGLGPSKGKDFANTLGPWITTPDELEEFRDGDRYALEMTVAINGETVGSDNLKNMSWSFEELLVYASRDAIVGAGDVLGSGTASTGALSERWSRNGDLTPPPLKVGDVVTMTVEGLGSIENRVVATTSPAHPVPRARRTYGADRL